MFRTNKKHEEIQSITEEKLISVLADVQKQQKEMETEKLRMMNKLKGIQSQAQKLVNDQQELKNLSMECARSESLIELCNTAVEAAKLASYTIERARIMIKTAKNIENINDFLTELKLFDPEIGKNMDKFREVTNRASIKAVAQLDNLYEPVIAEPELEEKAREWEERLLKGQERPGSSNHQSITEKEINKHASDAKTSIIEKTNNRKG